MSVDILDTLTPAPPFSFAAVGGAGGRFPIGVERLAKVYRPERKPPAPWPEREQPPEPAKPKHRKAKRYRVRSVVELPALSLDAAVRFTHRPKRWGLAGVSESLVLEMSGESLFLESTEIEDAWLLGLPM